MRYDVIIVGAGPGGIFAAYELMQMKPSLKVAVFEAGHALNRRRCPIDGEKIKTCIGCQSCSIMSGFGGAGAFSDGKYNITNDFGGTLYEYIGKKQALDLMNYVDGINLRFGGQGTKLYSTAGSKFKRECLTNDLHLLDASVRHLGTDINYVVLENLYAYLKTRVDFFFDTPVATVRVVTGGYEVVCRNAVYSCGQCIISVGRIGSKWMEKVCKELSIPTKSNRVDIGVRVELPAAVFAHLTDELYESKIVYRTKQYGDKVRTFCMNPKGAVVNENTNGIITVNGHSYEDPAKQTENTNFALLVAKHFSEPFKDSNGYGESIARLSNMLGGGVIVQRFGDLIRGRRSTLSRIEEAFITPTLNATPGDLSLVLPKRILDGIIEMIYALDKIAPGTANDDTLLYGVEVKFYNMEVEVSEKLESKYPGLYIIGDGSGITHSLSHASASGVHVARSIAERAEPPVRRGGWSFGGLGGKRNTGNVFYMDKNHNFVSEDQATVSVIREEDEDGNIMEVWRVPNREAKELPEDKSRTVKTVYVDANGREVDQKLATHIIFRSYQDGRLVSEDKYELANPCADKPKYPVPTPPVLTGSPFDQKPLPPTPECIDL